MFYLFILLWAFCEKKKKSIVVKKQQLFRHLILYLLLHYFGAVRLAAGEVLSVGQAVHENAFKSPKRFPFFTVSRRCPVGWIEVFARPILVPEPYV